MRCPLLTRCRVPASLEEVTNVLTWADPERQVAAALLTSGKPLVYPELYYLWDVLRQIGLACSKERARPRAAAVAPAAQRSVS